MSILIKPVQRINPMDKGAAMKWFFVQNSTGLVGELDVADLMADETTLNPMEAMMAIRQLRKIILRLLLNGNSVQVGNLGILSTTLSSSGAPTKEELTMRHINRINMNLQLTQEMDELLQKADFVRIDKMGRHVESNTKSTDL